MRLLHDIDVDPLSIDISRQDLQEGRDTSRDDDSKITSAMILL